MKTLILEKIPEQFRPIVISELKKLGYNWRNNANVTDVFECVSIDTEGNMLHSSVVKDWYYENYNYYGNNITVYSISQFNEFLIAAKTLFKKTLQIGDYEVKNISKDGFYVGCQFVSWVIFDKIAAKRPE